MHWKLVLPLAAAVSLCWCPSFVAAQEQPDATKVFNQGVDLVQGGKTQEAIVLWLGILDTIDEDYRPAVHKGLGVAFRKEGRLPEAWFHLAEYLRTTKTQDLKAGALLEKLEKELGREHQKIAISCQPNGTRLRLGGPDEGLAHSCPLTWWFRPGKHSVWATAEGFVPKAVEIDVSQRGGAALQEVVLEAIVTSGLLVVAENVAGAPVYVDDAPHGTAPLRLELAAGKYEVTVELPGTPWKKTVEIAAGQTVVIEPDLPVAGGDSTGSPSGMPGIDLPAKATVAPPGWKWGLVGGGAAFLATGLALQLVAYRANESLHDKYPMDTSSPDYASLKKSYDDGYAQDVRPKAVAAYALYGIGGAAAIAGAVLFVVDSKGSTGDAASTLSIAPTAYREGAGCLLSIDF